jgi:hypothetical protein
MPIAVMIAPYPSMAHHLLKVLAECQTWSPWGIVAEIWGIYQYGYGEDSDILLIAYRLL